MALNDREKLELAEVFDSVLEPKLQELRTEFAQTVVVIIECVMEDMAKILESQNSSFVGKLKNMQEERAKKYADKAKAGFK